MSSVSGLDEFRQGDPTGADPWDFEHLLARADPSRSVICPTNFAPT